MNIFDKLETVIKENNLTYSELNKKVHDIEVKNPDMETEELKHALHTRWQFIHNYATEISDIILANPLELSKIDLSVFDLVPYTVWKKMPLKSYLIINKLSKAN